MLETLDATGVSGVHVDLGHVGIYRGLLRDAKLDTTTATLLFEALQRKARADIDALLAQADISKTARDQLAALSDLNGGLECWMPPPSPCATRRPMCAPHSTTCGASPPGCKHVGRVAAAFRSRGIARYHYHTGPVFAAFVPGHGQAAAQGGRYDDIGRVFGQARPATGSAPTSRS